MSPEDGDVYVMSEEDEGEEWVSPTPVGIAVRDALADATDLEADDLDALEAYADMDDLRELLEGGGDEAVSFEVEGHDVTVQPDGEIDVE